ncbi:uncharacterized protein LOC129574052 [Sitodiplosis mosellana]|uniref:uncharacterized protein LOC129574052 n=1 Tax=Sitodiplosis mosellana TaxID=263140 RepID=UPI0024443600|nr:uncharacterized protein LOC129574052 [Sitodiplosis mosellana]
MEISAIPEAEREASEVLHSLLPVERIERKDENEIHRRTEENNSNASDEWEQVSLNCRKSTKQINVVIKHQDDEIGEIVDVEFSDSDDRPLPQIELNTPKPLTEARKRVRKTVKTTKTKGSQKKTDSRKNDDKEAAPTELESSAGEVSARLALGCECQGACFKDLQAESVYRHRLNIAELTKQEHDMYLMGVTMACLSNRTETNRHKERIRQRAVYVFQGKRVCLDAFIYLENVTQYHLKRIRRHVMLNGVTPRVHGNVRKKPHNALSLDLYKFAENFVKSELAQHTNDLNKSVIVVNEPRIHLYQKFRANCPIDGKLMSYSTFRHFLKKQFPHVRFSVNRPLDSYANRTIKREKKPTRMKIEQGSHSGTSSTNAMIQSEDQKTYSIGEYDTEAASDMDELDEDEEICVEFIANDDSYESDNNENNEYQDVDFLESEDE